MSAWSRVCGSGGACAGLGEDRLQVKERFERERADIAHQAEPLRALDHGAHRRQARQRRPVERDAAGDRIALRLLPRRRRERAQLALELGEGRGRQEVALDDKTVAREGRPVVVADQRRQALPAPLGHALGEADAGDMQPGAVQGRAADNRIVAERLGAGRQRRDMDRRQEPRARPRSDCPRPTPHRPDPVRRAARRARRRPGGRSRCLRAAGARGCGRRALPGCGFPRPRAGAGRS